MNWKLATSVVAAACLLSTQLDLKAFAAENNLSIRVIENPQAAARGEIVVKVLNGEVPAAGANVVFGLPEYGPGGLFSNGARNRTVQADDLGLARSGAIHPNKVSGSFAVTVAATLAGQSAETAVAQSNPADTTSAKTSKRRWLLVGLAAAGGVAAAVLLTRKNKSEPEVTVGPPTVGSPQ